ncbi:hypothetical protein EVAR_84789_1 [Eumeta japonica]|uniref:Uncharacterized protein n=1 Tax=Eumeta variegata TaxID=151549 RepID=A0A4C1U881_EUMVA|nr:hypothetical protein EVAR_84789_1 [Eumeta japonica]
MLQFYEVQPQSIDTEIKPCIVIDGYYTGRLMKSDTVHTSTYIINRRSSKLLQNHGAIVTGKAGFLQNYRSNKETPARLRYTPDYILFLSNIYRKVRDTRLSLRSKRRGPNQSVQNAYRRRPIRDAPARGSLADENLQHRLVGPPRATRRPHAAVGPYRSCKLTGKGETDEHDRLPIDKRSPELFKSEPVRNTVIMLINIVVRGSRSAAGELSPTFLTLGAPARIHGTPRYQTISYSIAENAWLISLQVRSTLFGHARRCCCLLNHRTAKGYAPTIFLLRIEGLSADPEPSALTQCGSHAFDNFRTNNEEADTSSSRSLHLSHLSLLRGLGLGANKIIPGEDIYACNVFVRSGRHSHCLAAARAARAQIYVEGSLENERRRDPVVRRRPQIEIPIAGPAEQLRAPPTYVKDDVSRGSPGAARLVST